MNEKFTSNNIKSDDSTLNIEDSDYEHLVLRLKEISKTLILLEKIISR